MSVAEQSSPLHYWATAVMYEEVAAGTESHASTAERGT